MLGLKLNHVGRRGPWYTSAAISFWFVSHIGGMLTVHFICVTMPGGRSACSPQSNICSYSSLHESRLYRIAHHSVTKQLKLGTFYNRFSFDNNAQSNFMGLCEFNTYSRTFEASRNHKTKTPETKEAEDPQIRTV